MNLEYKAPKITAQDLRLFARTNEEILSKDVKAIVLIFHGLGCGSDMRYALGSLERKCAENGILTLHPYYGPWSWMNMSAVRFVDRVVECACG